MSNDIKLDVLPDADGSAQFSSQGVSVLASVNGPLEVQRRDELPDEATIEVVVRPSAGLAGIRERFFEGLIHKTLKQVIRADQHPRTLIQVTLQVMENPETASGRPNQAASLLHILPALLNAAMLALLCSSIPLSTICTATIIAATTDAQIIPSPTLKHLQTAQSIHVMAFSSEGKLVLNQSEGSFNIDTYEACINAGRVQCLGQQSEDTEMNDDSRLTILNHFKQSIEARIQQSETWRRSIKE